VNTPLHPEVCSDARQEHSVVRVALITGVCPSGQCGVGDYTVCLDKALRARGVESQVIAFEDLNVSSALRVRRSLREQNFDIVHIEYPTVGFGARLGPQALSLLQGCVVTIHEASQRHFLRKLSLFPFSVRPERIIFTSRFERQFATTWAPWISRVSSVIPVGSNIGVGARRGPRNLCEVVHFGLIMPKKGVEQVVELSRLIKSAGLSLKVRMIGKTPLRHVDYLERLRSETRHLPIIWDLDLSEEQVAERLADASLAYLPYPDGASERRTTLKAALLNGVAVLTTGSSQTPHSLARAVKFCATAEEALAVIGHLIQHPEEMETLATSAADYGKRYTWERIAELHLQVYQGVLSQNASHAQMQSHRTQLETRVGIESSGREPW
jgi:glycosyltransferase involved in cell wall biosynthesis